MKNKIQFAALLAIGLLSWACKKENLPTTKTTNSTSTSFFKLGNEEFKLTQAFIEDFGFNPNTGFNQYSFVMLTEGITLVVKDNYIDSAYGKGSYLSFNLNSTKQVNVLDGTYVIVGDSIVNNSCSGFVVTNIDLADEESGEELELVSGTLTLSTTGTQKIATFDLMVEGGAKLTGTYLGSIVQFEPLAPEKKKLTRFAEKF